MGTLPKPPPAKQPKLGPPHAVLRVTPGQIRRYASAGGDHNPIHVSGIGAKAMGFPKTIAHGMWSAANILSTIEGRVPEKTTYTVRFGKPIFLPSSVNMYADKVDGGWDLSILHPKKGYPHLTATLR